MKSKLKIPLIILVSFLGINCTAKNKNPIVRKQYNYIIVLDLSDRLLVQDQWKVDTCLIGSAFQTFITKVKKELTYINATECSFKVKIPRYNGLNQNLSDYQDKLELNLTDSRYNASNVIKFNSSLHNILEQLYKTVLNGKHTSSDFNGTDIWAFFNSDLKYSLSDKQNVENRILAITDGYFDLENKMPMTRNGPLSSTSNTFFSELRKSDLSQEEKFLSQKKMGLIPVSITQLKKSKIGVVEFNSKFQNNLLEIEMLQLNWKYWMINSGVSQPIQMRPKESMNSSKQFVTDFFK